MEILPGLFVAQLWVLDVFEFVLLVGSPSDLVLLDGDQGVFAAVQVLLVQLEGIVEERFCDETAWDSWILGVKLLLLRLWFVFLGIRIFLIFPKVGNLDDRVTISELFDLFVVSNELVVVAALDVSSVVLVEVI